MKFLADKRQSEEATGFTLEEYGQLVEEIQESATIRENRAQGIKRARPEAQANTNVEGAEVDRVLMGSLECSGYRVLIREQGVSPSEGSKKRSAPRRAGPNEGTVLPCQYQGLMPSQFHLLIAK